MRVVVITQYDMSNWPAMDEVLEKAVGRVSNFAGAGSGVRDHGWVCQSEIETERVKRAIRRLGLAVTVRPDGKF